jgi:hypothetical protein
VRAGACIATAPVLLTATEALFNAGPLGTATAVL